MCNIPKHRPDKCLCTQTPPSHTCFGPAYNATTTYSRQYAHATPSSCYCSIYLPSDNVHLLFQSYNSHYVSQYSIISEYYRETYTNNNAVPLINGLISTPHRGVSPIKARRVTCTCAFQSNLCSSSFMERSTPLIPKYVSRRPAHKASCCWC